MRIAGERVVASLRRKVFSTIIRSDVATLEKSSTGELVSRLSADTIALQRVMTTDVVQLLQGFLETCVACAMLLILCKPLAPIIFIVVPMSVLAGMRYGYHTAKLAKSLSSALAQASAVATEQMDGIRIVKSFAREGFAEAAYDTRVGEVLEFGHRSAWADGILQGWNRVVFTMNTCTILLLGGRLVAQGVLSVGGMMAFVLYSSHLTAALGKLSLGIGEVMRARGSADRILNLLGTKPVIEKHISKQFADIGYGVDLRPRVSGDVSFRNVTFKYPSSDRVILRNLDFDIPAGGSVAFVGGSGAGKSTTSALLSRFYDPLSGEIFVDGKSLKDYDLRDVRQNIVGIISQEPYIISGTLADNIAFGRANASREEIEEAAEAAGVLAFAHKFPQGLDTVVTRLSSGEKQRVMIARCLAKKPQIMVLDEPTSALDRSSEAFVNETIERLIRDTKRTVILISHRLATVRCCEKILVFSNGEVVENGSHEDLVERGGAYCRLLNAVI